MPLLLPTLERFVGEAAVSTEAASRASEGPAASEEAMAATDAPAASGSRWLHPPKPIAAGAATCTLLHVSV